jgi:hypothetical protein
MSHGFIFLLYAATELLLQLPSPSVALCCPAVGERNPALALKVNTIGIQVRYRPVTTWGERPVTLPMLEVMQTNACALHQAAGGSLTAGRMQSPRLLGACL